MTSQPDTNHQTSPSWLDKMGSIGMAPTFHLIYLVFLFFPWFFVKPAATDVAAALIAVALFIPLHYYAYRASAAKRLIPIALVAMIGVGTAFFVVGNGVFHVYCTAMAGFHRPVWRSGLIVALCAIAYIAAAYAAGRGGVEIGFIIFMSLIIWVSTLSNAQNLRDRAQLEREHQLDKQTASLMERERIARDLHDLLGHTLTLVALKSDLANRLIDSDPTQAKIEIQEIQEGARRALKDVRNALTGLTVVSIASELDNAGKALLAAGVSLNLTGEIPVLPADQDKACGLMIREATTNIIRHTNATGASIIFSAQGGQHGLRISDNGGGKVAAEGRGLNGLRLRIEAIGGRVLIDHAGGVNLEATFPERIAAL